MLLYEVNLSVDADAADAYEAWLEAHIAEIVAIDGFTGASWLEVMEAAEGRREYVVQYRLRDREALESYFQHHAERLRRDGVERFGGRFSASRRVMHLRRAFE
jgi:heme-degrading monooxygenase HmoA